MMRHPPPAVIDNNNFTISDLNVVFSNYGQVAAEQMCIAGEGTSQKLVDQVCNWINSVVAIASSIGEQVVIDDGSSYKIGSNDFVIFIVNIAYWPYTSVVADGEFTVEFEFSSVDNSHNS